MMTCETNLKEFNCIAIQKNIFLKWSNMVLPGYLRQMEMRKYYQGEVTWIFSGTWDKWNAEKHIIKAKQYDSSQVSETNQIWKSIIKAK